MCGQSAERQILTLVAVQNLPEPLRQACPAREPCTIQELGPRLGVSARALRFWEERGLLSPQRAKGGVRLYDAPTIERAAMIAMLRRHGVGLEQIGRALGSDDFELMRILRQARDAKLAELRSLETLIASLSVEPSARRTP